MALPAAEILDVIKRSDRCYQTVRGYVAERHLEKLLEGLVAAGRLPAFRFVNAEGQPDFEISVGGKPWNLECKNVLRGFAYSNGDLKVDFQRTRNQLGQGANTGRYYKTHDFDILGACEYNQTGKWEFKFVWTRDLPQVSVEGVRCIVKAVRVPRATAGGPWQTDLVELLKRGPAPRRPRARRPR